MMTSISARGAALAFATAILTGCTPAPQQTDTTPSTPPASQPTPRAGIAVDTTVPASSDVVLTLNQSRYSLGGQVQLTIRSRTSDTLGFNPCTRLLERRDGSRWSRYEEPNRLCTMELWLLEPNTTRSATTELPTSTSAGTYRMVILLSRQKTPPAGAPAGWGTVRAVSAPFAVN